METFCGDYLYATGRGLTEAVEIGWGAIGDPPQYQLIDWTELRNRVAEKLTKGYTYADTPYVRMTPASLAKVMAPAPVAPSVAAVSMAAPLAPVVVPPIGGTGKAHHLKILRTGITVTGYAVIDDKGNEIGKLTPAEGPKFARDYNVDIELG